MSGKSFIKVKSSVVIEKASATIEWIKQNREKECNRIIADRRDRIVNGFWHKLLKRPVPTDQEIIDQFKQMDLVFNELHWAGRRYSENLYFAYNLLKMAELNDEVYLSVEDFSIIF